MSRKEFSKKKKNMKRIGQIEILEIENHDVQDEQLP